MAKRIDYTSKLGSEITGYIKALEADVAQVTREYEKRVKPLREGISKLMETYRSVLGKAFNSKPTRATKTVKTTKTTAKRATKKTRVRRSLDDIKKEAKAIYGYIESKGKDGVGGAEIKAKFPNIKGGIKEYLKKYAGSTPKTTGKKAQMRYYVA